MYPTTKNSKRIGIRILNPQSGCGHTSLQHARRYVRRGIAEWVDGAIRFIGQERPGLAGGRGNSKPLSDWHLRVLPGFARYPLPMMTTGGLRFPSLARAGAGLL